MNWGGVLDLGLWIVSAALLLMAVLFGQAVYTRKTALRLPEAGGAREAAGEGPWLLHVGESTVAGVGVASIEAGLTAAMAQRLRERSGESWCWRALGNNGATVAEALHWPVPECTPSLLVLTFGVNDTTHGTSLASWRRNLRACVERFAGPETQVLMTGVPPLRQFPLLPPPLSWALGWRAAQLDRVMANVCAELGAQHISLPFAALHDLMAEDGYHPNAEGYQLWGRQVGDGVAFRANGLGC